MLGKNSRSFTSSQCEDQSLLLFLSTQTPEHQLILITDHSRPFMLIPCFCMAIE